MSNNVCEFCGQVLMADVECECKEAKQARRILDQIERAKEAADEIFGENSKKENYTPISEECMDIIYSAIEQIAHAKIYAVTFTLPNGAKAKLTRSKGDIKIERSETKKSAEIVEERF